MTDYRSDAALVAADRSNLEIARRPGRGLRFALAGLAIFNLLSALAGMAGLTIGGGMGIPVEYLAGSPFHSYFWPGIILGLIVGGVQVVALLAQRRRSLYAWPLHAAAGLVMMIFIFVELAILLNWSPLHGIYFVAGLIQVVLAVVALHALLQSAKSVGSRR